MSKHRKINEILSSLNDKKNNTENIFLNVIHNELITFNGKIKIPHIPVKELDYQLAEEILSNLSDYVPEFLQNHCILKEKKPASEQHWIHCMQRWPGKIVNFIHMFKLDLKFGGDSSAIIEKGNTDFFPSFYTNRIYYKSRLIPELKKSSMGDDDFQALRIVTPEYPSGDNKIFTSALFDEIDTKKISLELCAHLPSEVFAISPNTYPFLSYDYFTACFNVIHPVPSEIETAITFFEPLFLFLYGVYSQIETLTSLDKIQNYFSQEILIDDNQILLSPAYVQCLHEYFQRFSLFSDAAMVLHGKKRFDIADSHNRASACRN